MCLPVDGSADGLLDIKALPFLKFPTEQPPPLPKKLSKKERNMNRLREAQAALQGEAHAASEAGLIVGDGHDVDYCSSGSDVDSAHDGSDVTIDDCDAASVHDDSGDAASDGSGVPIDQSDVTSDQSELDAGVAEEMDVVVVDEFLTSTQSGMRAAGVRSSKFIASLNHATALAFQVSARREGTARPATLQRSNSASTPGQRTQATPRRGRNSRTEKQKQMLTTAFERNPNPDQGVRAALAELAGMAEQQVHSWFKNEKVRRKKAMSTREGASANDITERHGEREREREMSVTMGAT
jgi:hypothetical protein